MSEFLSDLLDSEIEAGTGIGNLRLGKTKTQLVELIPEIKQHKSRRNFRDSIKLGFNETGYLTDIFLSKSFTGLYLGYLGIGSEYKDLIENFCSFESVADDYYELMLHSEKSSEYGIYVIFNQDIESPYSKNPIVKEIILYQDLMC